MTASHAGQEPRSGGILVVHDRVPGRARFEIGGLYRSPPIKRRLERGLGSLAEVQRIDANVRTGRLLLEYDPGVALDEILRRIAAVLGIAPQPVARFDPDAPKRKRPRLTVGDVLQGVADLVRPVEPLPAAVAGFHAETESVSQTQVIEPWHLLRLDALLAQLGCSPDSGLSADEAGVRLQRYGPNSLAAAQRRSDLSIFIGQFNSLPVGLLGISALVSFITGGALDAAVIIGVVLINSVIGFVTERQAEKTISSLSETGVRAVNVLRDGQVRLVPVETLVPGDVLELIPGSYIAADMRLLNGHRLSIDESALTGESMPVSKDHKFLGSEDTALGDRSNMAYMGTHVTGGSGRGMVVATAAATELGQIQTMVGEAEAPETPMQKQLDRMGTQLALLSGGVCAGVFGVGVLRGFALMEMLKSSVSLAVAAVPEGLPAVATTTLAMGISDMRKRNVAVRHLDAVETLGSVQVFCMDKTGTLTMNRMAVVMVYGGGVEFAVRDGRFLRDDEPVDPMQHEELVRLMQVVSLCSETEVRVSLNQVELDGSPTEKALVELALNAGIDVNALRAEHPTLRMRYRAEGRPFMSTLHPYRDGKHLLAVKGSPDRVLAMCECALVGGECIETHRRGASRNR